MYYNLTDTKNLNLAYSQQLHTGKGAHTPITYVYTTYCVLHYLLTVNQNTFEVYEIFLCTAKKKIFVHLVQNSILSFFSGIFRVNLQYSNNLHRYILLELKKGNKIVEQNTIENDKF